MNQQATFEFVLSALTDLEVAFMVTGSVAAMAYGEPRMTNDMDVVLELEPAKIEEFIRKFDGEGYYIPPAEAIERSLTTGSPFNLIHMRTGTKVDLIPRRRTEFARTEFGRRQTVALGATLRCPAATPEDVIISKLIYYAEGQSDKHLRDIRGILIVSGDSVNVEYVEEWVGRLGLEESWRLARP